jgi:hypothetical protein
MKKKSDKHIVRQKIDEEDNEEEEVDLEEEEEDDEDFIQAPLPSKPNKPGLQRKQTKTGNNIFGDIGSRSDDEEEEEERLANEVQAVVRLSQASSLRRVATKMLNTTLSGEIVLPIKLRLTFKEKLIKWFKSKWFSLAMIFVTAWTMISEDLRNIAFKAVDPLFYTIMLLI